MAEPSFALEIASKFIGALATFTGALIAVSGVKFTILDGRRKALTETMRQITSQQASLSADMRAILRVIDTAHIIEHYFVQYHHPDRIITIPNSPKQEDYFILYNAVAKDIGSLNKEFAARATAFYQMLKGSRDTARSLSLLREARNLKNTNLPDKEFRELTKEAAKSVIDMLEDVYRSGLLAVFLAKELEKHPSLDWSPLLEKETKKYSSIPASPQFESEDSAERLLNTFKTWVALVAIREITSQTSQHLEFTVENLQLAIRDATSKKSEHIDKILKGSGTALSFSNTLTTAKTSIKIDSSIPHELWEEVAQEWSKRIYKVYSMRESVPPSDGSNAKEEIETLYS